MGIQKEFTSVLVLSERGIIKNLDIKNKSIFDIFRNEQNESKSDDLTSKMYLNIPVLGLLDYKMEELNQFDNSNPSIERRNCAILRSEIKESMLNEFKNYGLYRLMDSLEQVPIDKKFNSLKSAIDNREIESPVYVDFIKAYNLGYDNAEYLNTDLIIKKYISIIKEISRESTRKIDSEEERLGQKQV